MFDRRRRKRHATAPLWAVLALVSLACDGGDEVQVVEGVIGRETFIEVYVDLRSQAVLTPTLTLTEEARDSILESHEVDEESLLAFIDAYGRELEFMNEVWAEIERRIEAMPPVPEEARRPSI